MVELYIHSPPRLHGALFNELNTGINFPLHFYKLGIHIYHNNWGVGIAQTVNVHGRGFGVQISAGAKFFSSPCRLDRLLGPRNLLPNG
jgi:hypothetical protein